MKKQLPILKKQLTNNWVYKFVALVVALSIWLTTLHNLKDMILVRQMELEFILRPHYAITNNLNRTVLVKVFGPRSALKKFSQTTGVITVNLSAEDAGLKHIEIHGSDLNLPMGVKLKNVQPSVIDVNVSEVSER
ncbi:MAG: hypothetical protein ABL927_05385 [Bdellovibrionales bacterium]